NEVVLMSGFLLKWAESMSIEVAETQTDILESKQEEIDSACTTLNEAGVRLMRLDGITTIGVWADMDGTEVRRALKTLEIDQLPVRILDEEAVPPNYKVRHAGKANKGTLKTDSLDIRIGIQFEPRMS